MKVKMKDLGGGCAGYHAGYHAGYAGLVTTCHDLPPALRRRRVMQRKRCRLQDVATSGICLTVGPGHRAIPRWKEGNARLPTVHRCVSDSNCEDRC